MVSDEAWRKEASEAYLEGDFADFFETVQVALGPGGRVTLDSQQDTYTVEVHYTKASPRRRRRGFQIAPAAIDLTGVSIQARPEETIGFTDLDAVNCYLYALTHYLAAVMDEGKWARVPHRLPEHGREGDAKFYKQLLLNYNARKAEGSSRPAADVADRLGKNRATVRSWLMRARELYPELVKKK